jgi:hypothetical protein
MADETAEEFLGRIYREMGGLSPELRRVYEFYKANYCESNAGTASVGEGHDTQSPTGPDQRPGIGQDREQG